MLYVRERYIWYSSEDRVESVVWGAVKAAEAAAELDAGRPRFSASRITSTVNCIARSAALMIEPTASDDASSTACAPAKSCESLCLRHCAHFHRKIR